MQKVRWIAAVVALAAALWQPAAAQRPDNPSRERFDAYWYPNGAEISRFTLDQSRYGGRHPGHAVLVFVTEALNPRTHVKADRPTPSDVPVLKLNASRKFLTGIYPYSTLTSVFSPIAASASGALPLKVSLSVQEWCGHVFSQIRQAGEGYTADSHSYFEGEGDRRFDVGKGFPEDGIWNRIRTAPGELPTGSIRVIPSLLASRFAHDDPSPQAATGSVEAASGHSLEGGSLVRYVLVYRNGGRRLAIDFETSFPHRIQRWEETDAGPDGRAMTTRAERTHTLMVDYWNRHDPEDRRLREKLGLPLAQ